MTPTIKRLLLIGGGAILFGGFVLMILFGVANSRLFFYDPSMVANKTVDLSRPFRLGGLVEPGRSSRSDDGLTNLFYITDCKSSVAVEYRGILPDLFIEGQGAVARGTFDPVKQLLVADEVLARHDEAYTPKEVEIALTNKADDTDPSAPAVGEYAKLLAEGCATATDGMQGTPKEPRARTTES